MRWQITFWTVILATASVGVFVVSERVARLEDQLAAATAQITMERDKITVLQAEWAFLNRPEWLAGVVAENTDLVPMRPRQILVNASAIPVFIGERRFGRSAPPETWPEGVPYVRIPPARPPQLPLIYLEGGGDPVELLLAHYREQDRALRR